MKGEQEQSEHAGLDPLPCEHDVTVVQERLAALARRGKLPGFRTGKGDWPMACAAFGGPFDSELLMRLSGRELHFSLRRLRKVPAIFAAVLAVTVWPGVILTDSLLRTYLEFYRAWPEWVTYAWYMPLTALPIPWMWRKWAKQSRVRALESALEMRGRIESALR